MSQDAEFAVTLSTELFRHLRTEARRLGVPMSWLVASMVLDTMEEAERVQTSAA